MVVGVTALKVTVGATLRIATDAVSTVAPPSLSVTRACTVRIPSSAVGQITLVAVPGALYPAPAPQSNSILSPAFTSTLDGSLTFETDNTIGDVSFTVDGALKIAVGLAFEIATFADVVDVPP